MKNWNESKKELKAALQKEFPGIKFSLRKRYYDTLDIEFTDTETTQMAVQDFTRSYNGKSFDGMTDSEDYHNTGLAFGYIFVTRQISDTKKREVFQKEISGKTFNGVEMPTDYNEFMEMNFYSEENKAKDLRAWGLDPMNMLYRFITEANIIIVA